VDRARGTGPCGRGGGGGGWTELGALAPGGGGGGGELGALAPGGGEALQAADTACASGRAGRAGGKGWCTER
jgi:hypothetical protein